MPTRLACHRYNPSRVSNVDNILAKYKGKEEVLVADLQKMYGDTPYGQRQVQRPLFALPIFTTAMFAVSRLTAVLGRCAGTVSEIYPDVVQ